MEIKFKLQKTPYTQPPRTQKAQKPSSLAFVHVDNPKQAKDKETLNKVRRHVMKDIGRSRRSRITQNVTVANPFPQSAQAPTYWGDVEVCVNFKRLLWAMEMVSGALLSITVVEPSIGDQQKISRRIYGPPSLKDIELYTQSLGTVRESILAESRIRRKAVIGTVICLSVFDMRVGNLSSWEMHMAGLQRLIDHIGGVETLDSNSPLRQALFLADILGALKKDITPKFPVLDFHFEPQTAVTPYTQKLVSSLEQLDLKDQTPIIVIRNSFSYVSRVAAVLNKQWSDNPTDSAFVLPTSEDMGYMISRREVPFQYLMSLIGDEFWDGKLELKLWLLVNQLCIEAGVSRFCQSMLVERVDVMFAGGGLG
ncbi:hypothetical protein FGSG_11083 [Fusarium graminearum PH-1]|uniref:Uncharacterized protein n=1 Tax=Gibberella zeae (strain ATCC MYA-4620 / CBS 123657 / FGSC 9075 / NRRL 31084 / PH-1) TaxID=229533 RepID=I1S2T0_GIBZE|nr:hypothetical protein FGSG_11083 [Fusarium graminearum PH-1]ESU17652.1 hypothetical protein FGSG_11083 [Fusarium graminearum PH-1]|eukprot:XP_011325274.1 hypothetical protein FGSG_11083 [Fusarium graminearum PH-1]